MSLVESKLLEVEKSIAKKAEDNFNKLTTELGKFCYIFINYYRIWSNVKFRVDERYVSNLLC